MHALQAWLVLWIAPLHLVQETALPKNKSRHALTDRSRGVSSNFEISRHALRELALQGHTWKLALGSANLAWKYDKLACSVAYKLVVFRLTSTFLAWFWLRASHLRGAATMPFHIVRCLERQESNAIWCLLLWGSAQYYRVKRCTMGYGTDVTVLN